MSHDADVHVSACDVIGYPWDHFTSLEESWLRLAAELESGEKLLDLIGEISRDLVPIAEAAE